MKALTSPSLVRSEFCLHTVLHVLRTRCAAQSGTGRREDRREDRTEEVT